MKINKQQLKKMIKNNEDVSNVDTSEITDMSGLFKDNKSFNKDISSWNVSKVENMNFMFIHSSFNNNIYNWNISNEIGIYNLFNSKVFDKNIFNLKKIINNRDKVFIKNMNFIKNNILN